MSEFLEEELANIKGTTCIINIPIDMFSSIKEMDLFVRKAEQNKCGVILFYETSTFYQGAVAQLFDKETCKMKDNLNI